MKKSNLISLVAIMTAVFSISACSKKEPTPAASNDEVTSQVVSDVVVEETVVVEQQGQDDSSLAENESPAVETKEQGDAIAALDKPSN